jgi:hypothetical protein
MNAETLLKASGHAFTGAEQHAFTGAEQHACASAQRPPSPPAYGPSPSPPQGLPGQEKGRERVDHKREEGVSQEAEACVEIERLIIRVGRSDVAQDKPDEDGAHHCPSQNVAKVELSHLQRGRREGGEGEGVRL